MNIKGALSKSFNFVGDLMFGRWPDKQVYYDLSPLEKHELLDSFKKRHHLAPLSCVAMHVSENTSDNLLDLGELFASHVDLFREQGVEIGLTFALVVVLSFLGSQRPDQPIINMWPDEDQKIGQINRPGKRERNALVAAAVGAVTMLGIALTQENS